MWQAEKITCSSNEMTRVCILSSVKWAMLLATGSVRCSSCDVKSDKI